MIEGYTNAVEVPTAVRRVGQPHAPVLHVGCGTGPISEALLALGQHSLTVDCGAKCRHAHGCRRRR